MAMPRLKYKGRFFVIEDNVWRPSSVEEVVQMYNMMAERHEIVLDDIEELVNEHQPRTSTAIHPRAASTA